MAITFTLVESTPYRLRYLAVNASPFGTTATIPNDGGATPDLRTDLANDPSGPLRAIVRAGVDGIGTVAAGALTQAQARAIMNSDNTGSVGNDLVPRAITTVTPRGTTPVVFGVDINVDGQADPVVIVTSSAATGEAYVDIHARHSIDL
jgi:hypothetical protein